MTLWGVFPFLCFPLKVAPARPLFQDRIETLCLREVRSFREENFPLIHPEVRLKNQNRKAANKKVRSAIMQRRQPKIKWSINRDREYKQNKFISTCWKFHNSSFKRRSAKSTSDVTFHGRCDSRRTIQQFNKQLESIP